MNPDDEDAREHLTAATTRLHRLFVPEGPVQWAALTVCLVVFAVTTWWGWGLWSLPAAVGAVFVFRFALDLLGWLSGRR